MTSFADGQGDDIGAERTLALAYARAPARDALAALWQLDARMQRLYLSTREQVIAEIKLAWWEERLGELGGGAVPAEPLLRQLAQIDATGAAMAIVAGAWRELFGEWTNAALARYASGRGGGMVALGASVSGIESSEDMQLAGEGWALLDLYCIAPDHPRRAEVLALACGRFRDAGRFTWPRALRPVGMIVELARSDAASGRTPREGSPRRVARMAWHALSGR